MSSDVTTEGLLMALPFENDVQVYDLKGQYLLDALEFSIGVSWTGTFSSGRMLQIAGMLGCAHSHTTQAEHVQLLGRGSGWLASYRRHNKYITPN